MFPTRTVYSARINLRLSETAKQRIECATSVEGKTLSALCWLAWPRICGVRWMDGYDGLCSVPP